MISIVIISKDEPSIDDTLAVVASQAEDMSESCEVVVIDASEGRLDPIRRRHEEHIRWVEFQQPPGVTTSIPHQRNAGVRAARGEVIVFTDAGCFPEAGWLQRLVAPLSEGEQVTAGMILATADNYGLYGDYVQQVQASCYLKECPTGNLAFCREVFDTVGGFDEGFAFGSDVDFSWRVIDAGYRIRSVGGAVVRHDWGTWRRQLRRSYVYGKARARLYRKHRARFKHVLHDDPMVIAYPVFLLGLPLALIFPPYLALLLIPAWRNRSRGVVQVLVDHLTFGAGVLVELVDR